ncbi:MAG TPA: hypothetical protein VLM16_02545 [Ginsengibacter sp.]|nr:hypothetical protein [Ginsengibacter sp.]
MKNYKIIGWLACVLLLVSCFIPLTYYADLNKNFTCFFSEKNIYGKPGVFFVFIAVISAILIYIDKIWAKRTLIFLGALNLGYLIKTYILFTSCYNAYCPEKKIGIYLLITSCALLFIVSLFPDMKLVNQEKDKTE